MKRPHAINRATHDATRLLGLQVARARRQRRWSAAELAERAGISRATLRKVETGDPTVALGTAFEVATLVGVPLFGADRAELPRLVAQARDHLAVLPARVREPEDDDVDDDF